MDLRLRLYSKAVRERNKQFLSLLEFDPQAKVIDLGCGEGDFSLKVLEKIGCKGIYGVDIRTKGIREAKNIGVEVLRINLSSPLSLDDNTFDVVVSNQVIEHILNLKVFVSEIYRILKPNGYAVISTENLGSWDNIFALLLGYCPFSMDYDGIKVGNPFSYNPNLAKILENTPRDHEPPYMHIYNGPQKSDSMLRYR